MSEKVIENWFYTNNKIPHPTSVGWFAYKWVNSEPRPGNLEDELVAEFIETTNQPMWVGDNVEYQLRLVLRRAADAAVRTTLDAEKPAGVVYETAEERAAKKPQQSRNLDEILTALNMLSFHLMQFSAKVASYSPQQDLKDATSVLEDAADDLQDAIGESGVLDPEQEVAQP